jgi:hypothetical protein
VPGTNLLVFRETRTQVSSQALVRNLTETLSRAALNQQHTLDALISAGELECALFDGNLAGAETATRLTDLLSCSLIHSHLANGDTQPLLAKIQALELPDTVSLSPPEGFAYYALHPSDFASLELQRCDQSALVIGIRSIGTVLSSIVATGIRSRGHHAARFTVRPTGHPFSRITEFSQSQIQLIRDHAFRACHFFVVDEGPGLSGTSFLSVGEALTCLGIAADRITFLGTRAPDPERLCAQDAELRWNRFGHQTVNARFYAGLNAGTSFGGGAWRTALLPSENDWPPCWPQMERVKFLSPDGKQLLKFDGFGRFGSAVRERNNCLFRAGFAPCAEDVGNGLSAIQFIPGRPLTNAEVSAALLERIARYCSFRASEIKATQHPQNSLEEMVRHNLDEFELPFAINPELLHTSTPVICDGHTQPEEWILTPEGSIYKMDGGTHGDDHFMPGPVDIAWDLAGAIVEWDLDRDSQDFLVSNFRRLSGDDPRQRLSAFVVAYSVFRLAYSKMACAATRGSSEESRWKRAQDHYLKRLLIELRGSSQERNQK